MARRSQRIETQKKIYSEAFLAIGDISIRELFLIGACLYWAEGSKEKKYRIGVKFGFGNMDPKMIKIMLVWLSKVCKIERNMISFSIFLHRNHKSRLMEVRKYWSQITEFPVSSLEAVYWKKNISKTNKKNVGENYFGVLRIEVRESTALVRKIMGWCDGIFEEIGGSSNGRTFGFGPKNRGSSPCPPAL